MKNAKLLKQCEVETPAMESRRLELIRIERRFGGFLPVLQFINGETENASRTVTQTPELALERAKEWIAIPAHNISWWIGNESKLAEGAR